ncbi:MAG: hypothetical protein HY738_07285 [Bacteroidia bacterium]|nr:hypothetical protein [Bacteroidia bacterium]
MPELIKIILLLPLIVYNLNSCNRSEGKTQVSDISGSNQMIDGCTVIGTVLQIYTKPELFDSLSPCSKEPCFLKVNINRVLNKGNRIPCNIEPGQEFEMAFLFGLSQSIHEQENKKIQNLEINDTIKVTLQSSYENDDKTIGWVVANYEKINF